MSPRVEKHSGPALYRAAARGPKREEKGRQRGIAREGEREKGRQAEERGIRKRTRMKRASYVAGATTEDINQRAHCAQG